MKSCDSRVCFETIRSRGIGRGCVPRAKVMVLVLMVETVGLTRSVC